MPASSRLRRASSPTLGMSRVISSWPSLVSRAMTSNSSMWIEVNTSSRTMRSEIRIESRSEEHTSELQSLMRISYAVFCLKKKKNKTQAQEVRSSETERHIVSKHTNLYRMCYNSDKAPHE